MKFRPCIDLHKGKVKQIVGSTLSDTNDRAVVINFETEQSAASYAQRYKEDNLYGGHVIMLGPGNEAAATEALTAFPRGLQIGGGITHENAGYYLQAGASHVIVTSYVFKNASIYWDNLSRLVDSIGKEHLVLDISCKRADDAFYIVTDRWQKMSSVSLSQETLTQLAGYCDEFLVHAADVEGKQQGVDDELVSLLAEYSPIPATYAGGIRSLNDLDLINKKGDRKVDATIGSALDIFGGTLKYLDVVEWFNSQTA